MKYFETKEGSLEEAISKAVNEKPDSSRELKESKMGALFLDMQIDAQEMSEKDFIKKYNREMGMNANELKRMHKEFNESTQFSNMNAKDLEEKAGKYLKYSDLLLQKGRLMAKNKNTTMIDREIEKEKKRLGIKDEVVREATGDKEKYQAFFNKAMKKFGVDSPADLKGDKKKEFFNYVDKNYKGDHEEELDKEDKPTVQKVVKMLKKASKAHADQSKSLEKDLQDNVDKTLDRIRESNVEKSKSMRSILADIWKVNEGKNPFAKDEGFASDAQRRAAFASGYKEKGKKKKEEVEKSNKTMTDKKPTKVEIEPEVK